MDEAAVERIPTKNHVRKVKKNDYRDFWRNYQRFFTKIPSLTPHGTSRKILARLLHKLCVDFVEEEKKFP